MAQKRLSDQQLAAVLRQAGFQGDALATALAVAKAESGGNPSALNPTAPDLSYGLFQINMLGGLGPARRKQYGLSSNDALYDPLTNAKVAFRMSQGGKNWQPWTTYTSGRYKRFLGAPPDGDVLSVALDPARPTGRRGGDVGGPTVAAALLDYARGGDVGDILTALSLTRAPAVDPAPGDARPAGGRDISPAQPGGIRELFYDPEGAYDEGNWISPIGGHSDHVHFSFGTPEAALATIRRARELGLRTSENPYVDQVDPVHTKGSYHYQQFPGRFDGRTLGKALDVSGAPGKMSSVYWWAVKTYGLQGGKQR